MKDFSSITRLDTSTPGYASGKPKNATSETSKDGTVINDIYLNDQYQFFAKCVRDSGIVPSGDFDNGDTIYQLFTAVQKALLDDSGWLTSGVIFATGIGIGSFRYKRSNGFIYMEGTITNNSFQEGGTNIITMPTGFRPTGTRVVLPYYGSGVGVWTPTQGYFGSNGTLSIGVDMEVGKGAYFNICTPIE